MKFERGGFVMGLVAGLLVGLALALGVALYITKAPVPFINKVPQRTAEQDTAEAERNRTWDPNAPLGGKGAARAAGAASAAPGAPTLPPGIATAPSVTGGAPAAAASSSVRAAASAPASKSARDPAAILASGGNALPGADPFLYFVQAGAFTRNEDAEQQRARLAMIGQTAKITEREQSGRTVYRVRLGPFPTRDEADGLQGRLQEQTIESQIVRVERP